MGLAVQAAFHLVVTGTISVVILGDDVEMYMRHILASDTCMQQVKGFRRIHERFYCRVRHILTRKRGRGWRRERVKKLP